MTNTHTTDAIPSIRLWADTRVCTNVSSVNMLFVIIFSDIIAAEYLVLYNYPNRLTKLLWTGIATVIDYTDIRWDKSLFNAKLKIHIDPLDRMKVLALYFLAH